MWAAGVVILEMYAGSLAALGGGRGQNAHILLEFLVRNTNTVTAAADIKGAAAGHDDDAIYDGRHTRNCGLYDDIGASGEKGKRFSTGAGESTVSGTSTRRDRFRVDMPEDVLSMLREIFKQSVEERPTTMKVK